jgi:cytochrome oxidase Cu insertion factor (SCO1/SenC/PrrC family)
MTAAHVRLAVLTVVGLVVGALTALAVLPQARVRLLPSQSIKVRGEALVGGPFTLVDHTGKRVTDADFRGRVMLVLFGSIASPDITAPALQVLSAALEKLGSRAERLVPILITVDPQRDTPDRLKSYLESFHPRLIGLTGSPEQIAGALAAYRVGSTVAPVLIYVMGPDGRYRGHLNFAAGVDVIAASLAGML